MRRVVAAGATDVGRVRSGNEDAYLVADSVFAVADGMGGHLAGEIASAAALEPVRELDGKVFPDASAAVGALRDAVSHANAIVAKMADEEPAYRGMGTTLTAVLIEGRRLHVAHVGDSRAYLHRNGVLSQLTDDHTLVQHLIDEGQISRQEAATHPQRSIITRAIGVGRDVEVDSMTLDVEPGDQILLCSDGLTGVVGDERITERLESGDDADEIVQRLVDDANARGGPDNITVVLLRCDPDDPGGRIMAKRGAAAGPDRRGGQDGEERRDGGAPVAISTREEGRSHDWAGALGDYGALGRDSARSASSDTDPERRSRLRRGAAVLLGLLLLALLVVLGGWFLLSQQYFVGLDGDEVVIYQGVDVSLGPIELAQVVERTDLTADDVPSWYRPALREGVTATDLDDARRIVEGAPRSDEAADGPASGPAAAAR